MERFRRVVVIGYSGTGALAAQMLKKLDPALEVTIIREPDEEGLLTRCACPYPGKEPIALAALEAEMALAKN